MPKRSASTTWQKAFARTLRTMTRKVSRASSAALVKAMKNTPRPARQTPTKPAGTWTTGASFSASGARRYRLFRPPGIHHAERLPLIVMLHGCGQNAEAFAQSTRMNRLAASKRFIVLYPEQERTSNAQNCWNWFDTRSGRAQREADSIEAAIQHACLLYPIDRERIALAGLSAGASMAALMAVRHPGRYRAIAMHAGVPPGLAHSSATAMSAMRGRRLVVPPLPQGSLLPPLLVIHGSSDPIVTPGNGSLAARLWAAQCSAEPGTPRTIRRGARYPMTITDYKLRGRLVASLCEVQGLGHAWSGGAAGQAYSDPKGPDVSGMIWAFAKKQFAPRS